MSSDLFFNFNQARAAGMEFGSSLEMYPSQFNPRDTVVFLSATCTFEGTCVDCDINSVGTINPVASEVHVSCTGHTRQALVHWLNINNVPFEMV